MTTTILGIDIAKSSFHVVLVADEGTADRNFSGCFRSWMTGPVSEQRSSDARATRWSAGADHRVARAPIA